MSNKTHKNLKFSKATGLLALLRYIATLFLGMAILTGCKPQIPHPVDLKWEGVETTGQPTARHEASFVGHEGKIYLIGGRRINPVNVFDPETNSWSEASKTPFEMHHFQAVSVGEKIYMIGAMTGGWPNETPVPHVMSYVPGQDRFETLHEIPAHRRRGGAGVAVYEGKIYVVGGITNGHQNGYVNWVDEYDPQTGQWRELPNAPHRRDHFSLAVHGDRLYVMAGRQTEHAIGNNFGPTLSQMDVFDLSGKTWLPSSDFEKIPVTRAGNMIATIGDYILVGGGESEHQVPAHSEVQAYHVKANKWVNWPSLTTGRHGTGFVVHDGYLYTASGCSSRGGEPEVTSTERIALPKQIREADFPAVTVPPASTDAAMRLWHAKTLSFRGPEVSEAGTDNPFLNYRLDVLFSHEDGETIKVRGFYAADGQAAYSSADKGDVWQARFVPNKVGTWTYKASLYQGENIALAKAVTNSLDLDMAEGQFDVQPSLVSGPSFRADNRGVIESADGYLRFRASGSIWRKGGTNSPENFLAFTDFDDTFRVGSHSRAGDATGGETVHAYESHIKDYKEGGPLWDGERGKGIIGAVDYLSDQGVNSIYMLTMNINGDGQDVWPYTKPDTFDRFDVSKLEQWNILFEHMQDKGVLVHLVIQETENELMLDSGDTGPQRQLYFLELIARFGHLPGLVWNLGEENGPVDWSPEGQTDRQRQDMADFFEANDPYAHPVLLHTHSGADDKDHIAGPLLGLNSLDGLSLQIANRETVFDETVKWKALSKAKGWSWTLTMDEIGLWHTGALPDNMAGGHDSLRRHVLWGHFLAAGAGVEWYAGAHYPYNDLNMDDFRVREDLWQQTRHALDFFNAHVQNKTLQVCSKNLVERKDAYCASVDAGQGYLIYLPETGNTMLNTAEDEFDVYWYDPQYGGGLHTGSVKALEGGNYVHAGLPPFQDGRDWLLYLKRK